ncbi:RNA methyltransferase, partial [bacterium]|nr:RNA methyltransferase [bacterium]
FHLWAYQYGNKGLGIRKKQPWLRRLAEKVGEAPVLVALDGINDPGNLGTIIRIADWYGINTIYCSSNTVDFYNSKVIQSTMGSFLRVNVIQGDLTELLAGKDVYATLLDGENIRTLAKPTGGVLLIGNEANGIEKETLNNVKHTPITIPGNGNTESLNAAMATAICCERLIG